MTAAVTTVLTLLGGSVLAQLFTDNQWSDIQSFLNFLVLIYLVYDNRKVNPTKTAEATVDEFRSGPNVELAESLVDAMERRRQRRERESHQTRRFLD